MVSDEIKNKGKLTLERINQKERLKEILLERQQLEHLKHIEVNALRRADHVNAVKKEHALLNEFKVRVAKKIHQIDSAQRDFH